MSASTPIAEDVPFVIGDPDAEPSLADILDDIVIGLEDYLHLSSPAQAHAIALWAAHTYAIDQMDYSPRLAVQAPTRGSGKTRVLEVLNPLVKVGWLTIEPSAAVLFRTIEAEHRTVLLDEVDLLMTRRDADKGDIIAVINSGYQRGATVPRMEGIGTKQKVRHFNIYGPMALAGIGTKWTDTTLDRSIVIPMEKKTRTEPVTRFRRAGIARMKELGQKLAAAMDELIAINPDLTRDDDDLPSELRDRAQNSWEGMLTIGELASPEWGRRALAAAIELSSSGIPVDDDRFEVIALRDIRRVFAEASPADPEFLTTSTLIEEMKRFDASPWNDEHKPLNSHRLARHMRQFKIFPIQPVTGANRGYHLERIASQYDRIIGDTEPTS